MARTITIPSDLMDLYEGVGSEVYGVLAIAELLYLAADSKHTILGEETIRNTGGLLKFLGQRIKDRLNEIQTVKQQRGEG